MPYLDLKFRCFKNDGVIMDEDEGGVFIYSPKHPRFYRNADRSFDRDSPEQ
jgi:hypothetical protein